MNCFRNATVYVEGRGLIRTDLSFDARIRGIGDGDGEEIALPEGAIVLPGFVDEHIHGADGHDGMDATKEALTSLAKALPREGTTAFLVTTMTAEKEKIKKALSALRDGANSDGATILGVHLEGPFLSPDFAGAQAKEHLLSPSAEVFDELQAAAGGKIRLVTLAPELTGAKEFIAHLVASGVQVSLGHSGATYKEAIEAASLGADSVTHTYNAMSKIHHRDLGLAGAALLCDALYAELICDGHHVSFPAVELLVKNKTRDKLILITDSMRAKYLPDGVSELGGQTVIVKDGEARLENGTLAGSLLKMNEAVRSLSKIPGCSLLQAVDAATINPARHLRIDRDFGSIALGKRADFAVVDQNFNILSTYVGGKRVF